MENTQILLIEDDLEVAEELSEMVISHGISVTKVCTVHQFNQLIDLSRFSVIIVDLGLPDGHGNDVIRKVRQETNTGILVLSGHNAQIDKVLALEIGADDYVEKPFAASELLARLKSLVRRVERGLEPSNMNQQSQVFEFCGWSFDVNRRRLKDPENNQVNLTKMEFDVLEIFLKNQSHILSRDSLVFKLRGQDWAGYDRAIDGIVCRLRVKLKSNKEDKHFIQTIRGLGYLFSTTE